MPYECYPTAEDLDLFLQDAGLTPPIDLDGAIWSGIQAFERATDRHFLAGKDIYNAVIGTDGEETRVFDPALVHGAGCGYLDFGPYGDVAAFAAVDPVVYTPFGGTPEPLRLSTDYFPEPPNALATGHPFTGLAMRRRFWPYSYAQGCAPTIGVTGKWGFGTSIPPDAHRAMILRAAIFAVAQITTSITNTLTTITTAQGGLVRWTEADVTEEYATAPHITATVTTMAAARMAWEMDYERAVAAFRRVAL